MELKEIVQSAWTIHHMVIDTIFVVACQQEKLLRGIDPIEQCQYLFLVIFSPIHRVGLFKLIHENDHWLADALDEGVKLVPMPWLVGYDDWDAPLPCRGYQFVLRKQYLPRALLPDKEDSG